MQTRGCFWKKYSRKSAAIKNDSSLATRGVPVFFFMLLHRQLFRELPYGNANGNIVTFIPVVYSVNVTLGWFILYSLVRNSFMNYHRS